MFTSMKTRLFTVIFRSIHSGSITPGREQTLYYRMVEQIDEFELPADTLAILNEFREEQQRKYALEESGQANIDEDWQLSQFWYSAETATSLCREAVSACGGKGRIVCVSSPTLMQYFHEMEEYKNGHIELCLLEFDDRFGKRYPTEFVHYDYNHPHAIPDSLKCSFDVIVADPPFLATDCLLKTAQTVRLLSREGAKIILCTGAIMEEMAERLLGAKRTKFEPRHSNNLANDFACFANYEPLQLV